MKKITKAIIGITCLFSFIGYSYADTTQDAMAIAQQSMEKQRQLAQGVGSPEELKQYKDTMAIAQQSMDKQRQLAQGTLN